MTTLPRRTFMQLAAGAAAVPLMPGAAAAQAYPSRPISLLVFVPAGGSPDISSRYVGQALSQRLGQSIVIENRPGAGGTIALQTMARAEPDGYTLMVVAVPHAINLTTQPNIPVKVTRDVVPVAGLYTGTFVMVVSPSLPVKTVAEFIAYAKANPGKVNMTSSGAGNLSHLSGELFKVMTGIDVVQVPYKGATLAHTGLIGGEVHVMFDAMTSALPNIRSGRLRALGVTSASRTKALPDVPPIMDTVKGYEVTSWLGIGAPVGTPREIVDKLNTEINAVLRDPAVQTWLANQGSDPLIRSPAEFGRFIAAEADKWAKVIRAAAAKPK